MTSDDDEPFRLDAFTNAKTCSSDFIQDEKRIQIDISTPDTESNGYMLINVPQGLIGGNYTVLVDDKKIDSFRILGSSNEYVEF